MRMGLTFCPDISVTDYHSALFKVPEGLRSHLNCGRSLKSWIRHEILLLMLCTLWKWLQEIVVQYSRKTGLDWTESSLHSTWRLSQTYVRRTSVPSRTRAVESGHSVMTGPSIKAWGWPALIPVGLTLDSGVAIDTVASVGARITTQGNTVSCEVPQRRCWRFKPYRISFWWHFPFCVFFTLL